MDPLSALVVAASVVQFTDVGIRLLSTTREVYISASGQTKHAIELSAVATDLKQLSEQVEQKSCSLRSHPGQTSDSEEIFLRLCGECQKVSTELLDALAKLKARGRNWLNYAKTSFLVALKSIWSEKKIDELRKRLSRIKEEMTAAALFCLWEEAKLDGKELRELSKQQVRMIATLDRIDETTHDFSQNLIQLAKGGGSKEQWILMEAIKNFEWNPRTIAPSIEHSTDEGSQRYRDQEIQAAIIQSLVVDNPHGEKIPEAYRNTFEWIFKDSEDLGCSRKRWSSFPAWLTRSSKDIYWITGKPGSGKSTLMKFILCHPKLQALLREWANDLPLLIGGFYFWKAGAETENSREALMKTLLRQCLSVMPALIPKICRKRWTLLKIFGTIPPSDLGWTFRELAESVTSLALESGKLFKLAFFIDGLDEFGGDHAELVDLIHEISLKDEIKLCVSSRPLNLFSDRYRSNPNLKLQDLTRNDIDMFVRKQLTTHAAFRELQSIHPIQTNRLLDSIIEKAGGVFLWVAVVVRSLLESLTEGETLADLEKTVSQLPSDLEKLYFSIWASISTKYKPEASEFFQIREAFPEKLSKSRKEAEIFDFFERDPRSGGHISTSLTALTALHFFLAFEDTPVDFDVTTISAEDIIKLVRRRINSRTRCLLEVFDDGGVDYLHRTVYDWSKENWLHICSQATESFDIYLKFLRVKTALMSDPKEWEGSKSRLFEGGKLTSQWSSVFWHNISSCIEFAYRAQKSPSVLLNLVSTLDNFESKVKQTYDQIQTKAKSGCSQLGNTETLQDTAVFDTHWPTTIGRGLRDITFVGFAAQICLSEYVKFKVSSDPSLTQSKSRSVSILECAVFGWEYFISTENNGYWSFNVDISTSERYDLVSFLLRKGSDPTEMGHKGKCILEEVRRQPIHVTPLSINGKQVEYWDAIEELLRPGAGMKNPSSGRRKRFFNQISTYFSSR